MWFKPVLGAGILAASVTWAVAQEATVYTFDGSFDDAAFGLESAIVGRGLVIDHVSHVGEMLARTAADVGSDVKIFDQADVYQFCSAVVSRKVMEADPTNLVYCPYGIFVAERDGEVTIGYRNFPDGPMQDVQTLLDDIVREAAGL
jgi:uncharacterized protein (DUF302 family)